MKSFISLFLFLLPVCLPGIIYSQGPYILENGKVRVEVSERGDLSLVDVVNQVRWGNGFTGWIELGNGSESEEIDLGQSTTEIRKEGDELFLAFNGIQGEILTDPDFVLDIKIQLLPDGLRLEILRLNTRFELHGLEYPAHLFTVESGLDGGYITIPNLQGILIPSRYDAGFMRYGQNIWETIADVDKVWSFESGTINMPWFGAHQRGSSIMAHMETSSDAYLRVIGNAVVGEEGKVVDARQGQTPGTRLSSLTPLWIGSKGKLGYSRSMVISLVDNGYVGMSHKYREIARESGRLVTMKEKIAMNADYEKIIGAVDLKVYVYTNRKNEPYYRSWSEPVLNGYSRVHTRFSELADISADLKEEGVEKAMILAGGWNRMGYDREHVDMWPPALPAGGTQALADAAREVVNDGYLFALHDNYNDFYPDAPSYDPKYILREKDGSLMLGGVWDGGLSQLICTSTIEPLMNRNLDSIQGNIPLNAYYFDVLTNTWHDECYGKGHEMTRKDDLDNRLKLMKNIVDRGLVIGGERGTDWSMPVAAYYEGMQGGGTGYHYGIAYRTGLTVPLFYLVYHDCVVGYWQHGTPAGREDHANHMLLDLLYAQPSSWSMVYDQWADLKHLVVEASGLQGKLHSKTAHEVMTDHQVLTEDYMVQKSTFANGIEVFVNFGITTYNEGNIHLPPKGFLINYGPDEVVSGHYSRGVTIK